MTYFTLLNILVHKHQCSLILRLSSFTLSIKSRRTRDYTQLGVLILKVPRDTKCTELRFNSKADIIQSCLPGFMAFLCGGVC